MLLALSDASAVRYALLFCGSISSSLWLSNCWFIRFTSLHFLCNQFRSVCCCVRKINDVLCLHSHVDIHVLHTGVNGGAKAGCLESKLLMSCCCSMIWPKTEQTERLIPSLARVTVSFGLQLTRSRLWAEPNFRNPVAYSTYRISKMAHCTHDVECYGSFHVANWRKWILLLKQLTHMHVMALI